MMKNFNLLSATLLISLGLLSSIAHAQQRSSDFGKREFESNCASCHGVNGKGSGPVTPWLSKSPPDLTTLAKMNNGILPMDRLYQIIMGESVPAHGTRDMPVWGQEYRVMAAEHYMDSPYDPEAFVRARVLSLLEYINRLQVDVKR